MERIWFCGPIKCQAPMKLDCRSQVPVLDDISLNTEVCRWNESHAIFNELGVPIGEHTKTFLAAFVSCWLCLFVITVRDAACIHPGTISVASSMEDGQAYCLSSAMLRAFVEVWLKFVSPRIQEDKEGIFQGTSFMLRQ